MLTFVALFTGALVGFLLWCVVRSDAGIAAKLLAGLPLTALLWVDLLALWFPEDTDDDPGGQPSFLKFTPRGWKMNEDHPAAKYVFRVWTALGLVWLGALDEVLRHDFSNLLHAILG